MKTFIIKAFIDSVFMTGLVEAKIEAYSKKQAFNYFVHINRGRKFYRKEEIFDVEVEELPLRRQEAIDSFEVVSEPEWLESDFDQEFDSCGKRIA